MMSEPMTLSPSTDKHFILSVFDRKQWCPVLQARFEVSDLSVLRKILGLEAEDDPDLRGHHVLDQVDLLATTSTYGVRLDPAEIGHDDLDVMIYRQRRLMTPYLVHTGYELPLLLDGRKTLARMGGQIYPPMTFKGEDRFDHWVGEGRFHREEVLEPDETLGGDRQGLRTLYYTLKGEEWRVPAMRLIWKAAGKEGWNESFERLEGMLFGYEDWQNDWWIEAGRRRGGFCGAPLCCAVTVEGLAWMESAGFRALPPCCKPTLDIAIYDDEDTAKMRAFLLENAESVALVRFAIPLWRAREVLPPSQGRGRWAVPRERLPELNRHLRNAITVALRRDDDA